MPGVKRSYCSMQVVPSPNPKRGVQTSRALHLDFFGKLLEGSFSSLAEVGSMIRKQRLANRSTLDCGVRPTNGSPQKLKQRKSLWTKKPKRLSSDEATSNPIINRDLIASIPYPRKRLRSSKINGPSTDQKNLSSSAVNLSAKPVLSKKRGLSCLLDLDFETDAEREERCSSERAAWAGRDIRREDLVENEVAISASLEDSNVDPLPPVEEEHEDHEPVVFLSHPDTICPLWSSEGESLSESPAELAIKRGLDHREADSPCPKRPRQCKPPTPDDTFPCQSGAARPKLKRPLIDELSPRKRKRSLERPSLKDSSKLTTTLANGSRWQRRQIPKDFFVKYCPRNTAINYIGLPHSIINSKSYRSPS